MSQDMQRWRNQDFACTVYQKNRTFWIEAVNVDVPEDIDHMHLRSLEGMRGKILKYYIDKMLRLLDTPRAQEFEENDVLGPSKDMGIGFGIQFDHIEIGCQPATFKRKMARDPDYCTW